jgi:hypothetical protein
MKNLAKTETQIFGVRKALFPSEDIGMPFVPGSIGDLRDYGVNKTIRGIKTEIKAHWIEGKSKMTQMRENPDWAAWEVTGLPFNPLADSRLQGDFGVSQVIHPSKPDRRRAGRGPKPSSFKYLVEFIKVEVSINNWITEGMGFRFKPPMPYPTFVETTVHDAVFS